MTGRVKAGSTPIHLRDIYGVSLPIVHFQPFPSRLVIPQTRLLKLKLTKLSKQYELSRAVLALLPDRNLTHNALGRLELSFDRLHTCALVWPGKVQQGSNEYATLRLQMQ